MAEPERSDLLLRYVLGTADGKPAAVDLRNDPATVDAFENGEFLAGLVAKFVSSNGLAVPGGFATPPEMVVVGALPMAFKTHAAVMHLCRLGYVQDAHARVRTIFELALDLRYMLRADDPQECAQRWLDWAIVEQHRLWGVLDRGDEYYSDVRHAVKAKPREMQEVLDAIKRVKAKDTHWFTNSSGKRQLHNHWAGKDSSAMAREVDWERDYDTVFREASRFIHPGVHGFSEYFRDDNPLGWITIDASPSVEGVRGVLASANIYFAHVLRAWVDVLGVDEVGGALRVWMDAAPEQDTP